MKNRTRTKRNASQFCSLVFVLSVCACGPGPGAESGTEAYGSIGADDDQRLNDAADTDPTVEVISFTRVYNEVFRDPTHSLQCSACHAFLSNGASQAQLYTNLVGPNADPGPCVGETRVVPGDLGASLLWKKLAPGVTVCGAKMPAGGQNFGPPPTQAQLDLLRAWIESGANP